MRIPDEWLDAVFFLGTTVGENGAEAVKYKGTGFVLSAPSESASARQLHLVTARHNIEGARKEGNLWLRVNTRDGRSISIETDPGRPWVFHHDPSVDLAIAAPSDLGDFSFHQAMSTEMILTPHDTDVFNFGIGSELLTIGLFGSREGEVKNIPVIRTGIVSAMPGEPISDGTSHSPYRGYLAEILSMGGMSGSPVLYHPTSGTEFPRVSFYLVGVIRSHWDEKPPDASADLPRREYVNRGIAAVTPASGLQEMLGLRP
jgi:hypothetical protein